MRNIVRCLLFICFAAAVSGCRTMSREAEALGEAFRNPPESTKPWTYWYWIHDNISKEGITKDLEAMARAGIGEALIGNVIDSRVEDNRGSVQVLTEEWWDCVGHAIREGERLGVGIGMFNCPGWSQSGGPWVKPEEAMQYLSSSELRVTGPRKLEIMPEDPVGLFRRVALQAFPAPEGDGGRIHILAPKVSSSGVKNAASFFDGDRTTSGELGGGPAVIELSLDEPRTVRSIQIYPTSYELSLEEAASLNSVHRVYPGIFRTDRSFTLEAALPGGWKQIASRKIDRWNLYPHLGPMTFGPICETFDAVASDRFRILFSEGKGGSFSEIELSGAARLSFYVEKQLGKMYTATVVPFDAYVWHPSAEPGDSSLSIEPAGVVDLAAHVGADGILRWDVPPGEWIILNTGTSPTLTTNKPTTPEARGFEVDKMSREAVRKHFDAYIGELLRRIPSEDRKGFRRVIADSYEQGSQNWTDGFAEDFRETYGYDFYPWLPVLTGRIVESAERSDRFLWDMRRLVADKIPENYVRGLREKCEEHGLTLWLENYGHWGFPGEMLSYGGASHEVGGEFWLTPRYERSYVIECRSASSAAHTYGKPVASAEAFTAKFTHRQMPRDLKLSGDWAFAQGINHYVLHVYIHQPDERKPGMNAWFGTDFNRHSTWFASSGSYFEYIRRSCAMLQSGRDVADIAYFIGEDTPKQTGAMEPPLPPGYNYDFINGEVLREYAEVRDGRIVLPSGASYRILVLPPGGAMRPGMLAAIAGLVKKGAVILGDPPVKSPSNRDYPACDADIEHIAAELWGGIDGEAATERRYGKGHVFRGISLEEALSRLGSEPDVVLPDVPQELLFSHRQGKGFDVYFVSNQSPDRVEADFGFRTAGMRPELFDAIGGEILDLPVFTQSGSHTFVPLELEPGDSWFVVFRKKAGGEPSGGERNFPRYETAANIGGGWDVRFTPSYDAPREYYFTELTDWTENSDPYIKYFSGTATYSRRFDCDSVPQGRIFLDLGQVNSLAAVRVNCRDCGTLWRPPYSAEITGVLAAGGNTVEIDVVNCWLNRLVGDLQPGVQPLTWTPFRDWDAGTPLIPSGLPGPVRIVREI